MNEPQDVKISFHFLCFTRMSISARSKAEMSDSTTVLEAFKFIEKAAAEFSDEDEDEDNEGQNKTIVDLATVSRHTVLI